MTRNSASGGSTDTTTRSAPTMMGPADPENGLCLLVVEDDEADTYLILRALLNHPAVATVAHAPDGVEALRMLEAGEVDPDLAFIDLQMPRKNGLDLLLAFNAVAKRRDGGFPMVVLTSSASPADAQRSRIRSAVRVITKPESAVLLGVALTTAIDAAFPYARLAVAPRKRRRPVQHEIRFVGVDPFGYDKLA